MGLERGGFARIREPFVREVTTGSDPQLQGMRKATSGLEGVRGSGGGGRIPERESYSGDDGMSPPSCSGDPRCTLVYTCPMATDEDVFSREMR
jgi:hypothetical protein